MRYDDRPRRPQEEEDYRDEPPRKADTGLWLALGLGGAAFAGVTLFVLCGLMFWIRPAVPPPAPPAPAAVAGPAQGATKQVRTRDELKTAVMEKTMEEVKALLGAPSRLWESDGNPVWTYEGISRDPASGTDDRLVDLVFGDGRVSRVVF
jgi:hypothetical protein